MTLDHAAAPDHESRSSDPVSAASHPTADTYGDLTRAFDHFNRTLFAGRLQPCLITLRAKGNFGGYFSPNRFVYPGGRLTHEIALNVELYGSMSIEYCLSILVHEMAHQAQHQDGTASRRTYHNRAFANLMAGIGLPTSSTGRPGGATVGERMSHYIQPGGPFIVACRSLIDEGFRARWADRFITATRREWIPPADLDASPRDATSTTAPGSEPSSSAHDDLHAGTSSQASPQAADTRDEPPAQPLDASRPADRELPPAATNPDLFYRSVQAARSAASKTKFSCPQCDVAAWGKPSLRIRCDECDELMVVR